MIYCLLSPAQSIQSQALGEEGLGFTAAVLDILEDLQGLIAMNDRLVELAKIRVCFAQSARASPSNILYSILRTMTND